MGQREKPIIIMVGADKGGVGKTTVCRALLDFLDALKIPTRAFDTEFPKGDLKSFYPSAQVIDLGVVKDQMKVFDDLTPEVVTVVDIRAGVLSPTLRALHENFFLDDVRKGDVILWLFHVLGPNIASLKEVTETTAKLGGGAKQFIVKNHINDTEYDLANDPKFAAVFESLQSVTINVPKLTEAASELVQQRELSFAKFASGDGGGSRILRGYVRNWLSVVAGEFDRVGVTNLVSPP